MAYEKDLILPRVGQAIESAQVTHLRVEDGSAYQAGDILLEIETDKSVIDVPAPEDGQLIHWCVAVNDMISGDSVIARVAIDADPPDDLFAVSSPDTEGASVAIDTLASEALSPELPDAVRPDAEPISEPVAGERRPHRATPAVRRVAAELAIDLDALIGTGPGNRLVLADLNTARVGLASVPVAAVPADLRFVPTPQGDVAVRITDPVAGQAVADLVLLHGLFGDSDVWNTTGRAAARLGFRVVTLDLPCHGQTPATVTDFHAMLTTVGRVIDTVSTGPLVLMGHSVGGLLAAQLVGRAMVNPAHLLLLAPAGLGTQINHAFVHGMLHSASLDAFKRETRKLTSSGILPSDALLITLQQRIQHRIGALTDLCATLSRQGVQQLDCRPDLDRAPCPVTLVHGRRDAIIPWEHAMNTPSSTALYLPDAVGHMPQWEAIELLEIVLARVKRDCLSGSSS